MKTQNLVAISGNTYPVKDALKAIGARWNADDKCWMISLARADEARKIVEGAGPKKAAPAGRTFGFRRKDRDDDCELCGRNRYTCGHCIGW